MFTSRPGWLTSRHSHRFRSRMQCHSTCFMFAPEYIPSFGRGPQMNLSHSILIAFKCMTIWIFNTFCFRHVSSNLSTSWPKTGVIGAYTRVCRMDHMKEEDQSFFRPDGSVCRSLQTTTTQRGGTLIRSATLPIRTEEVIALIGFELGRRFHSTGYVGQTDFEARRSTEPVEPRSYFPFVHPSWQEFDPPTCFRSQRPGMANASKARSIARSVS